MRIFNTTFLFLSASIAAFAQESSNTNRGKSLLYQNGKIGVVVVILVVIFLGIAAYLWRLDKKITTLENQTLNENNEL